MGRDAHFDRNEVFAAAACLGAHASRVEDGFRLRDVRFLIELFSNWVHVGLGQAVLSVQNTQVARYVDGLAGEGYARRISRKGYPVYRLTRLGLIELVSRLVGRTYTGRREYFFFLYYFIKNYRFRLEDLVKREGRQFPPSLKIELSALLDDGELLRRELDGARQELKKLDVGIADALATSRLVARAKREVRPLAQVVKEVERLYPYQLNSQKPLSELINGIPVDMRQWELEQGNQLRVDEVFQPSRNLLAAYIRQLEGLGKK